MCTNGVNTAQFEQMLDQLDDHVALEYRWSHKLAHTAEDAGYENVSENLHRAQALLADVRALIDESKMALEDDAEAAASATVRLV
ncbi:Uncharacterised protein [Slackia heliotrinireducens]|uniref:Dynein gamma chain protein n=1 Tax=Slackia heliotrinireducens (strain ATCC 29202 / DSM 20476 / NCTC 11029 / RHS 1) TaxID=471855 RepID=C7N744_SLAHD|nr:hypothetical protein [Slackia heliotrinireducens]ACV22729.1 hypothetical protein Shel_17100 [Slackia heliotrinireducens DSM 20476]VEH01364.1 Uncharacterised protein [Slackia heliotrinireducens]